MSLNASCLSGSRRPAPRPEQHGVCWQQCNCDAAGKECGFTQECVGFIASLQRGTEWAATGSVTSPLPTDFPTADKVSSRPFAK